MSALLGNLICYTEQEGPFRASCDSPWRLYRTYDEDGVLLYVGMSRTPGRRWRDSPGYFWKSYVAYAIVDPAEMWPTREEAEVAESDAIRAEVPVFNWIKADARHTEAAVAYLASHGADPTVIARNLWIRHHDWRYSSHEEATRYLTRFLATLPDQTERPA